MEYIQTKLTTSRNTIIFAQQKLRTIQRIHDVDQTAAIAANIRMLGAPKQRRTKAHSG